MLALQQQSLVTESAASKSEEASSTQNQGDDYKWCKCGSKSFPGNRGNRYITLLHIFSDFFKLGSKNLDGK